MSTAFGNRLAQASKRFSSASEYTVDFTVDKSREGTYVDPNCVPAGDQGLDERSPTANMMIEAEIARLRERLKGGAANPGLKRAGYL